MRVEPADYVRELTAVLSVVSLALVFGAAGQRLPTDVLPRAPAWVFAAIPHVNVALSLLAIAAIVVGWRAIRRGDVERHRRAMLTAFGLFAGFLVLYLYNVALTGPTPFGGPDAVYRLLYLPLLIVHVSLAVVCLPLLYYVLLLAATRPVSELRESLHPRVGRYAAALWLVSFTLGIGVYLLIHVVYG